MCVCVSSKIEDSEVDPPVELAEDTVPTTVPVGRIVSLVEDVVAVPLRDSVDGRKMAFFLWPFLTRSTAAMGAGRSSLLSSCSFKLKFASHGSRLLRFNKS
ncbi:hypothetical protein B9Z55_003665 [Caenorhabditis nigoni]|uniref:Uncharacterized protein n=1 Tax=Caenorhabditis nigoni TaxID=1611254 RepID=A0A2G5VS52_9PELO|nr:hypothetical protein B9Z55_003665 [Caenorhabditis nigoni]